MYLVTITEQLLSQNKLATVILRKQLHLMCIRVLNVYGEFSKIISQS